MCRLAPLQKLDEDENLCVGPCYVLIGFAGRQCLRTAQGLGAPVRKILKDVIPICQALTKMNTCNSAKWRGIRVHPRFGGWGNLVCLHNMDEDEASFCDRCCFFTWLFMDFLFFGSSLFVHLISTSLHYVVPFLFIRLLVLSSLLRFCCHCLFMIGFPLALYSSFFRCSSGCFRSLCLPAGMSFFRSFFLLVLFWPFSFVFHGYASLPLLHHQVRFSSSPSFSLFSLADCTSYHSLLFCFCLSGCFSVLPSSCSLRLLSFLSTAQCKPKMCGRSI